MWRMLKTFEKSDETPYDVTCIECGKSLRKQEQEIAMDVRKHVLRWKKTQETSSEIPCA